MLRFLLFGRIRFLATVGGREVLVVVILCVDIVIEFRRFRFRLFIVGSLLRLEFLADLFAKQRDGRSRRSPGVGLPMTKCFALLVSLEQFRFALAFGERLQPSAVVSIAAVFVIVTVCVQLYTPCSKSCAEHSRLLFELDGPSSESVSLFFRGRFLCSTRLMLRCSMVTAVQCKYAILLLFSC